jgi:glycosyltransferase involved in cell wall biosynthesis
LPEPQGGRRPSVAIVAHDIHDAGGMERALAELIRRIHRDGRVVVIASRLADELRPLVEWRPIRVPPRPFPLKFATFFLLGSLALARTRTDVVHVTGAVVANRADLATVHFCHAGFREATGALAPHGRRLLRKINSTVAGALALGAERWSYRPSRLRLLGAVSRGVAAEITRHYHAVPVLVTPNGVDVERFAPDADERERIRQAEGITPDKVLALFVGGDWDHKGLAVAIKGVATAQDHGDQLRLWVLGSGQQQRFLALAREVGVGGKVRFFGVRADVERFYRAADIFVLPTAYETFSLAAHEAAASMLPIVATRVSGIEDLVGNDQAGVLVPRTSEAVGAALARLAANKELRQAMGAEGRRRVAGATWERSTASVVALYDKVLLGEPCVRLVVEEPVQ